MRAGFGESELFYATFRFFVDRPAKFESIAWWVVWSGRFDTKSFPYWIEVESTYKLIRFDTYLINKSNVVQRGLHSYRQLLRTINCSTDSE